MLSNPYGCHMQVLTGPAKNIALSQRGGRILKLVSSITLDRGFIQQWRANNPGGMTIYRPYFGDNNLDQWRQRCDQLIGEVRPYLDLVDVVETPFNECNEGINDGISDLADAELKCIMYLHTTLPGVKISGGHFSTGTPYGFPQDYAAYARVFPYLDYFSLHEYDAPAVDSKILTTGGNGITPRDGRCSGIAACWIGRMRPESKCLPSSYLSSGWMAAARGTASAMMGLA